MARSGIFYANGSKRAGGPWFKTAVSDFVSLLQSKMRELAGWSAIKANSPLSVGKVDENPSGATILFFIVKKQNSKLML